MISSPVTEVKRIRIAQVAIGGGSLMATFSNGERVEIPFEWYPRLKHGAPHERNRFELSGGGAAIHWPDLDEDISAMGLHERRRSMESEASLREWLEARGSNRHFAYE